MKKIALEEHFITQGCLKYTEKELVNLDAARRQSIVDRLLDLGELRIAAMDQAGIDVFVLSLTGPGVQDEPDIAIAIQVAHEVNDYLAEKIQRHPTRFRGFAHLPMQDPRAAADELERCVRELQFVGGLINGQTGGHYLDEELYYPFWERVEALDVPVYLHPGTIFQPSQAYNGHKELLGALWGWTVDTGTHALRMVFGGTFERFPKTRLILGHMGETLPYLLWRFDSRWKLMKHANLSKQPSEYIKNNIWVTTSGVCSNGPLLCAVQEMGENRVIFSVDYPYESWEVAAQFIEKAPLEERIKERVCYKNASELLKINL